MDYEYRAALTIIKGGFPGEDKGTIPENDPWHPGSESAGPTTFEYYFSDSNNTSMANSSRVTLKATESWTAQFDDSTNNLTITISTKIDSLVRGNIRGNPLAGGNWTRDIWVGRQNGGPYAIQKNGDNIGNAHTISGPVDLGTETITIPPGGEVIRGSIYILNHTSGLAWTERYMDEMWAGTHFRNNRPAIEPEPEPTEFDYRPGANYNNGGQWMSHNRNAGAASVYNGASWQEMRTHYDGEEYKRQSEQPPYIYTNSGWQNMLNVGEDHWPTPPGNPYEKNN